MSTVISVSTVSPSSVSERTEHSAAHFATRWPQPSAAIVTAHGELDASNASAFVDYALNHAADIERLVLDLSGVGFFGTAGFTALHTLNVRCANENVDWAMVPSAAVDHLLRICDPDATLPMCETVQAALSVLQSEDRPLLKLIPESR